MEWINGRQYLFVSSVGHLSLVGTVAMNLKNLMLDVPINFLIGEVNQGIDLQEEMRIVRREFPKIRFLMKCEFSSPYRQTDSLMEQLSNQNA